MKKCIICNIDKNLDEFNIEHIIPQSIGNTILKLDCVCTECNSLLGSKIDHELTNNIISQLFRFENRISGYSGEIPNPFEKGRLADGSIVYVDGNLKSRFQSTLKYNEQERKISVLTNNIEEAKKSINTKLKRLGEPLLEKEEIEKLSNVTYVRPEIIFDYKIDFTKLYLSFIKIAYEYMYFVNGTNYLYTTYGRIYRMILQEYIYKDISPDLSNYIGGLPQQPHSELIKKLKESSLVMFQSEYMHMLSFQYVNGKTFLHLLLFSTFFYNIIVSDKKLGKKSEDTYTISPINGMFEYLNKEKLRKYGLM